MEHEVEQGGSDEELQSQRRVVSYLACRPAPASGPTSDEGASRYAGDDDGGADREREHPQDASGGVIDIHLPALSASGLALGPGGGILALALQFLGEEEV